LRTQARGNGGHQTSTEHTNDRPSIATIKHVRAFRKEQINRQTRGNERDGFTVTPRLITRLGHFAPEEEREERGSEAEREDEEQEGTRTEHDGPTTHQAEQHRNQPTSERANHPQYEPTA
jgi:hypothetical protein